MQKTDNQSSELISLTGQGVSAYVANNPVQTTGLPDLIRNVHAALNGLAHETAQAVPEASHETPTATQIRKSVTPDGIVSFIDGKTYKTMKRHLTGHGFDPHSYRAHFGLPADYPMVAERYAAQRSELAKAIGLGRVGARSEDEQSQVVKRKKAA